MIKTKPDMVSLKQTTVVRNSDGTVLSEKKEVTADKDRLKTDLKQNLPGTPVSAHLVNFLS